jgi:CBS-domain-containing membrane protein
MQKSVQQRVVREVMTGAPITVGPKTDIRLLKAMFETYEFNAFPVVDEHHVLLGVVTRFDFLRMFRPEGGRRWIPDMRALWAERVEDIMTRGLVTVGPGDSITTVVDEILRSKLRSLPVVERRGGKDVLAGIVRRRDVLSCLTLVDDDRDD